MPHVHSMTIFDADRISIRWDADCNAYAIELFANGDEIPTTKINIWRNAEGGPRPDLRLEGIILTPMENADALDFDSTETDR